MSTAAAGCPIHPMQTQPCELCNGTIRVAAAYVPTPAQEREGFEKWANDGRSMGGMEREFAWDAWQARAALDTGAVEALQKERDAYKFQLDHLLHIAGKGTIIDWKRVIVSEDGEMRNPGDPASSDLMIQTIDAPIYEWRLRCLGKTLREVVDDALASREGK